MRAYRTEYCYGMCVFMIVFGFIWDKGKAGKLFYHGGLAFTIITTPLPFTIRSYGSTQSVSQREMCETNEQTVIRKSI